MLYVPTNEARTLQLELSLETPHARGPLRLGSQRVDLEPDADRVEFVFPASEAQRGLSRLDLLWRGAEPLVVTEIRLSEDSSSPGITR